MNNINLSIYNSDYSYPLWHPYSPISADYSNRINFVRGEDCFLYDINNKKYLDASSGLWNISLGYSNEHIKKSIIEQLEKLSYCSLFEHTSEVPVKAAKKILSFLDSRFKKILFTCSGSESIELSVKLMRKYWSLKGKKDKYTILSLKNSYHGTYYASLTASSIEELYVGGLGPLVPGFSVISSGDCTHCESKEYNNSCDECCLKSIRDYIEKNYEKIAGIVIEPILASNGVQILSKHFIEKLCTLCKHYDILICIDEVATGFYRTGKKFYYENFDITPNLICMSKGLNSGYLPIGAVAVDDKIAKGFEVNNATIIHGSTQNGNLLACASVTATLEEYEKLDLSDKITELGDFFRLNINKILKNHENFSNVYGKGLINEIELVSAKNHEKILSAESIVNIQKILLNNGLIVYRSENGLTILPMLISEKHDIEFIVKKIEKTFENILMLN